MKGKLFFCSLLFVICSLLITCSSGMGNSENAVIVLDLGDSAAVIRAASPDVTIDELHHMIYMKGPTGEKTYNVMGAGSFKASVAPGTWEILVEAFFGEEIYAKGSAKVEIRARQSASVTVKMTVIWAGGASGSGSGGGGGYGPGTMSYTFSFVLSLSFPFRLCCFRFFCI